MTRSMFLGKSGFDIQSPSGVPRKSKDQIDEKTRRQVESELRSRIRGEVRFDDGDRALYATDGSNYRFVPVGVVIPRSVEEVVEITDVCQKHDVPVVSRGGGTDLSGSTANVAVVIDMSKYLHHVLEIDPERRIARVQPGTILDHLRDPAEKQYGLTFGPDPATHNHNTFGGMLGNNSCGIHSVLAAKRGPGPRTSDNVREMEILTYDGLRMRVGPTSEIELERIIRRGGRRGEIYQGLKNLRDKYADLIRARFPQIPRRVSGYNLDDLLPEKGFNVARALVGSEGTLVTILEATVELMPTPKACSLVVLGYNSVFEAGDHVPEILKYGPVGLEGLDHKLIENIQKKGMEEPGLNYLPKGKGFLLVEFEGETKDEAVAQAMKMLAAVKGKPGGPHSSLFPDLESEEKIWEIRESGLGATARVPDEPDTWPGWEDSAVPPEKVGVYLRSLRKLYDKYGYEASLYGHFGQGCIHTRIPFDLKSKEGIRKYREFLDEASDLCLSLGGSLSGEHGDGQCRAELLEKMFGPELIQAFREFKTIWDPRWKMNPGKVVDPRPITSDLRLGVDYNPLPVKTYFKYPDDHGSFARATTRCVGVGKCRRTEGGTMCPSYMATREEKHSTRGRAHLLFEMLQGDPIKDKWKSDAVKDALDLCLACKGCKKDCPVNVDMATYKAEFLAHYYKSNKRPMAAYSMGFIHLWSKLAKPFPGLVNLVFKTPGLSEVAKKLGGIELKRDIPPYAPETFQEWFKKREPKNPDGPPVILWPDTFNNYFHTETSKSAVRVLEAAGFKVEVPQGFLCCGRPLYDFGFLDQAQRQLVEIIDVLRPRIREGVPMVGLEPSCVSVFRDELINLFPHDQDARRLKEQTYTLAEFLNEKAKDFDPPKLHRKAILHLHCHHKSVLGGKAEKKLLQKMELDLETPDTGCCGMAGSFGFEPEKYDVSMAVGERVLLPKVREAESDAIILTEGFSCRTQIEQGTPRKALHLAQVIDMALKQQEEKPIETEFPEKNFEQPVAQAPAGAAKKAAALVAAAASFVAAGYLAKSSNAEDLLKNAKKAAKKKIAS